MTKFKIGDLVRIIDSGRAFPSYKGFMDKCVPRRYHAGWQCGRSIDHGAVGIVVTCAPHLWMDTNVCVIQKPNGDVYMVGEDGLSLEVSSVQDKIVITTDGKTTVARLYDGKAVVKVAKTKCAPSDEFKFETGAKIAFNRLMFGTDYNPDEVKIKAEDFDWDTYNGAKMAVLCDTEEKAKAFLKKCHARGMKWSNGKDSLEHTYWNVYRQNTCYSCYDKRLMYSPTNYYKGKGYEIVQYPFTSQAEIKRPTYLNGKAVCVDDEGHDYWTAGKVYTFVDGQTSYDDGVKTCDRYETLVEAGSELGAKFIEFKG